MYNTTIYIKKNRIYTIYISYFTLTYVSRYLISVINNQICTKM